MRCLALAEAWRGVGGCVLLLTATPLGRLESRLTEAGVEILHLPAGLEPIEEAKQVSKIAVDRGARWLVLDGYRFGPEYHHALRDGGAKILVLDDIGDLPSYRVDAILNQNAYAEQSLYPDRLGETQLFLGSRFVLIRDEYLKAARGTRSFAGRGRRVVLSLGGGDPENVTGRVLDALRALGRNDLHVVVAVGAANLHGGDLERRARNLACKVELKVDCRSLAELMIWADIGVFAGGTVAWEACFMGLPFIVMAHAENQRRIVDVLSRVGAAVSLGWFSDLSADSLSREIGRLLNDATAREGLGVTARRLVDGKGRDRVVSALRAVHKDEIDANPVSRK